MNEPTANTPRIIDLAEQLISDIETRRLKPGDRYLTTCAASKFLGVGNGVANRALQLLERRQIITRQQRSGAFVANLARDGTLPPLRRVHFLVHQNYFVSEGVGNDQELLGMQEELPGVHVQISLLPKVNTERFVADLIHSSLTAKARDGFVLVRAPYEVHKLVGDSGVPAIVYGGIYPGITRLPRLDRDMAAVGHLAADYLVIRGHRRLAFLSRQEALPGDHATMDAIRDRMSLERLLADSIVERFLPRATIVCEAEVARLLKSENRPTGLICRTQGMAEAATSVIHKSRLKSNVRIDVFLCDYYLASGQRPQYVFPRPVYSAEEIGRHIARMLAAQARGEVVQDEVIPVELDAAAASVRNKSRA